MQIGNDPALWRFDNVHDAIAANTELIARLIRVGEEQTQMNQQQAELLTTPISVSESA